MLNTIIYIVSTLFTFFMGKLSKKYGWNEELPIPVQNILVGLGVLVIAIIYTQITGRDVNIETLIEQIISAMGGSGTATLYYDNTKGE